MATASPSVGPALEPPTSPLPAIPSSKPRKSLPLPKTPSQTPSKLKVPSSHKHSALPTPLSASSSSPSIPTLRSVSSLNRPSAIPEKTLRKTISIASFPQPPNAGSRPTTSSSTASAPSLKPRSSDIGGSQTLSGTLRSKRSRLSTSTVGSFRGPQTPSLLNSSGEGKSIPSVRTSGGQYSLPSPPQSRSSSAQGSYSTSATTFDDTEDVSQKGGAEADSKGTDSRQGRNKNSKGNVLVSVRVRPDAAGNDMSKADGEWMVDGRRSLVAYRGREGGDYYYDNVFATHDNNAKVYDASAKRLVRRVMEGYHGTVFAYGMTGTGKTFSMQGTATNPGVIPLAITDIFSYIRETPHREFLLRVSYLEIYNEKIQDLLAAPTTGNGGPGAQQEEIKLREDPKRGVYATPLKEEIVQSPTQLLRVIARGDHNRRTGSTQYNARSSRSHAVVQIVVESRERVATNGTGRENKHSAMLPGGVRVSTLSLIDLAGSERAAEDKERRTEGAHINKSLLTLGTVIARLSTDKDKAKDGKHLPYRDSKLTRLLQPALSGNSLVSILCTIQIGAQGSAASAYSHTGETLNTLKFAARAKNNIVSHAKKAEEAVGSGATSGLLERYRSEIQSLRSQLDTQQKAATEKEERQVEKEAEQRHEEQMLEMQLARTALKERIEHLNRLILCSKSTGVNTTSGTVSALGMHARFSGGTNGDIGSRSARSSASQSTLGANNRTASMTSLANGSSPQLNLPVAGEEEDDETGEYGDGYASLQAQNKALQSDLQDKNRYIATLEKRLLQARRSSHSRVSVGFSHKGNIATGEDAEMSNLLQDKDAMILDLRGRLEDKERMLTALRSAARKRDVAELPPEDHSRRLPGHQSNDSNSSSQLSNVSPTVKGPMDILSPEKQLHRPKRSVDEVSKILDEMIQDKVESGHLIKGRSGSVRLVNEPRRVSAAGASQIVPSMGAMASTLRDSVIDPTSPAS